MENLLKFFFQILLTLTMSGFGVGHASVLVPSDLRVEKPEADVPANCARFFNEAGWGQGRWNGVLETQFWVEKINPDCTANVVYAWGDAPTWSTARGFERVVARIAEDRLQFNLINRREQVITVTFTLIEGGNSVAGVWSNPPYRSRVILLRGTAP